MIFLFHGSDVEKVRAKAFAWVAAARAKEPNLSYARLAREELSQGALEDAAQSGGLFVKRLLILIDDPFPARGEGESASAGVLEEALPALAKSDNAFVLLAPKLSAALVKKFSAKAEKTYVFDRAVPNDARGFNANLVNALAMRSREKLWLEVVRALRQGDAPEMLHGLLHWKARDLMQKGARAWKPAEARALSLGLIGLLVESRRKALDLSLELERWALSV